MRSIFLGTLSLFLLLISSCTDRKQGVFQNDEIDPKAFAEIATVNEELIDALKANDLQNLKKLMSTDLAEASSESLSAFTKQTSSSIKQASHNLLEAYHIIDPPVDKPLILQSSDTGSLGFHITFKPFMPESMVVLLIATNDQNKHLITAFYAKFDNTWLLTTLQFGRYTIGNKTAPALFLEANELKQNNKIIPAINRMTLAYACAQPAGDLLVYNTQHQMDALNQVLTEIAQEKYPLPMKVDELPTKPEIFKLSPQLVEDEICTMVRYMTSININDTVALEAENGLMHQQLLNNIPELAHGSSYVFYRAFNQVPNEEITTPYYGFVRETKSLNLAL